MIRKICNNKGSAMQVAIIALLLVGIFGTTMTSMVINQIKTSHKNAQNTELKYDVEAGIDEVIGKFVEDIETVGEKSEVTEFDILHMYVNLAYTMVGSNGIVDGTINNILNKISEGTATKTDMDMLVIKLGEAQSVAGGSNPDAKKLLEIAKSYAQFFANNFFDKAGNLSLININQEACRKFILEIKANLSELEFQSGNGNNATVYKGNIGVVYRDSNTASKYSGKLNSIYETFISKRSISKEIDKLNALENKEAETKSWAKNEGVQVINMIKDTNYTSNIQTEIENINRGGYIDENTLKKYYSLTGIGQINMRDLVSQRLSIVKREIDMLLQWIEFMRTLDPDNSNGGGSVITQTLIVSVPKSVDLSLASQEVKKTKEIKYDVSQSSGETIIKPLGLTSDKYKFKVLKTGLNTQIVLNLCIESQLDGYKIESNVDVKINKILNKNDYKVDYEIKDWKKVNTP